MFMLGAAVENGGAHHTPLFDIDEDVFPLGVAVLAGDGPALCDGRNQRPGHGPPLIGDCGP